MTPRQHIESVCRGGRADRPPRIGGWITSAPHLQALTGCTTDQYWSDPPRYTIEAYRRLGVDGLVGLTIPRSQDEFRGGGAQAYLDEGKTATAEDVGRFIDELPRPQEIIEGFDMAGEVAEYCRQFDLRQASAEPMAWMPAQWNAVAKFHWFEDFGYESYLIALMLYEDKIDRLFEYAGVQARLQAEVVARSISSHGCCDIVLTGQDICSCQGPMAGPEYLRRHYWPRVRHSLEPLLEVGAKIIWHCDGNITPVLDDILALGVAGLQGFQPECGVELEEVVKVRTSRGEPPIILGPVSVVEDLPRVAPTQVAERVRHYRQVCSQAGAPLLLFTSNTIGPEVPLENIRAMYEA